MTAQQSGTAALNSRAPAMSNTCLQNGKWATQNENWRKGTAHARSPKREHQACQPDGVLSCAAPATSFAHPLHPSALTRGQPNVQTVSWLAGCRLRSSRAASTASAPPSEWPTYGQGNGEGQLGLAAARPHSCSKPLCRLYTGAAMYPQCALAMSPRFTCGPQAQRPARMALNLCQPSHHFVVETARQPGGIEACKHNKDGREHSTLLFRPPDSHAA